MSQIIEKEPAEAFDWHQEDLFNNPPYELSDMVRMLNQGRFIIEGKPSTFEDAINFAHTHEEYPEVWDALREEEKVVY